MILGTTTVAKLRAELDQYDDEAAVAVIRARVEWGDERIETHALAVAQFPGHGLPSIVIVSDDACKAVR